MSTKPAPDTPLIAVVDKQSGELRRAHGVDAREMVASGHYRLASANDYAKLGIAAPDQQDAKSTPAPKAAEVVNSDAENTPGGVAKEMGDSNASPPTPVTDVGQIAIAQLPEYLQGVSDADVLLQLEANDPRPEAKPYYEARFFELAEPPRQ